MKKFLNLSLCAAGALAMAALAPGYAEAAGSAANAKILNVVTVTYYDATGTNVHQAATSTSVTVALKQAALTVATTTPFAPVDSGSTASALFALTANANGSDNYKVSLSDTASNLSNGNLINAFLMTDVGATGAAYTPDTSFSLGATSIVSVQAASGGAQTLSIPGGALNGIGVGSIVVINGTSYKVSATSTGSAAKYGITGLSTNVAAPGDPNTADEVLGSLTIVADPNGSATAPTLTAGTSLAGTIIGERKYLQVKDQAVVTSNTANGTDVIHVNTSTFTGALTTPQVDQTAIFYFVSLSINKTVINVTNSGAGATGKPGDVLEYTVTVFNPTTSGNAGKVSVADAVPAYTTLVSGTGTYGSGGGSGVATEKFATINDGTNTVDVTLSSTDAESQGSGATTGFGGTQANAIVAGTPIVFYIGAGASNTLGGTVAAQQTYTIKYQVKIN